MARTQKKEVATQYNYTDERPDYLPQETTRGQENVTASDITIPRLGLVQDLSPQRKKTKPEYIEEAESGMLFNNVTNELYKTGVTFVPVYFRKEFVIWKLQSAGGGFEGAFPTEMEAIEMFKQRELDEDEHEIVEMAQHFGMILHADRRPEEIVISMSKSKMKVNRQLNTLVKMAGGDRFSRCYKVTAVEDQNREGQDYYNLSVAPAGFVSEPVFRLGEVMYDNVKEGIKDVSREAE